MSKPTKTTTYLEGPDRVLSLVARHDGDNHGSVRLEVESGRPLTLAEARALVRAARTAAKKTGVKITRIGGRRGK